MPDDKPLVHIPRHADQSFPVSKIRKLELGNAIGGALIVPSLSDIATQGVSRILTRLHYISHTFDSRSHDFLREVVGASYAIAMHIKHHPDDWPEFCDDPFWQGHRQGPRVGNRSTILRHTLVRVFGRGDKRASDWKARLAEQFDKDVAIKEVLQQLERKALVGKGDKNGGARSRRGSAEVVKIDGSKIAGRYDLGLLEGKQTHTYKVRVEEGIFARASIVFELYESRKAPISMKRAEMRAKIEKALAQSSIRNREWVGQFLRNRKAGPR